MSQSAETTQWELGNKLACQQTGLSLVTSYHCWPLIGRSGLRVFFTEI